VFPESEYRLEDISHGRRLEFWSDVLVDRPVGSPDEMRDSKSGPWPHADLVFEATDKLRGVWQWRSSRREEWVVSHGDEVALELRPNSFGHLGVFPEHALTWPWIKARTSAKRVLNLFAHTGGATMAACWAGAEVTHVDSAPSMRKWGRRNAELSELINPPIRWITEDAQVYAERELRRGNKYDGLILDPPTFGRGPNKEIWRIDESLPELLAVCRGLLAPEPAFALVTCHTPGYTPVRLAKLLGEILPTGMQNVRVCELFLSSRTGKRLSCGAAAYWSREGDALVD
jgi:23S rRNA (cytosine1962-C5)-methyltransferase